MSIDNDQIVVPSRTFVHLAPKGTAVPDDMDPLPVAFKNVGLTTEDSLSFSIEPDWQEVRSAQSDYPTYRFKSGESGTISVDLQQWNEHNFRAVFGGGTVTETSTGSGVYKFVPPRLDEMAEFVAIVEVRAPGGRNYRYVVPSSMQVEGQTQELGKGQNSNLALRLAIMGGDDTDSWYLLTDDPAFSPAA